MFGNLNRKGKCFFSHGTVHSAGKGVLILIKNNLEFELKWR